MGIGSNDIGRQIVALLPRLRRFALALARAADAADDLVQATVARALERQEQREAGTRLDRWLFQIMKSVWLNSCKPASVRRTEPLSDHDTGKAMAGSLDGATAMDAQLTLDEVRIAFGCLSIEQQRALLLVTVEGYSHKEAAALLDVPIGSVISRIARGRIALAAEPVPAGGNVVVLRRHRR